MNNDCTQWDDLAAKLRRALGLCSPTPEEANHAMNTAQEVPMTAMEIQDIVRAVTLGHVQVPTLHPQHAWTEELDMSAVADDMLVLNRNPGEEDAEVDGRVEELRREALEEEDASDEQA
jgi:hypothetical protein